MEIVKSAIKYKDEIFTGYGHEECFIELFKKYKRDDINSQDIKEGFVIDSGEFVDRASATVLSQLEDKPYTRLMLGNDPLMSEDLYVYWLHEKDEEIKQLQKHITDMEQEQIAIMKEHEEFMKQAQQQVEQLEKENEFLQSEINRYKNLTYEVINSNRGTVKIFPCHRCGKLCNYDADYPYNLCYECDKQLNSEVYGRFEKQLKKQERKIKALERENKNLKKQNSLMYQQGLEQGKFDKKMEQEYGKS